MFLFLLRPLFKYFTESIKYFTKSIKYFMESINYFTKFVSFFTDSVKSLEKSVTLLSKFFNLKFLLEKSKTRRIFKGTLGLVDTHLTVMHSNLFLSLVLKTLSWFTCSCKTVFSPSYVHAAVTSPHSLGKFELAIKPCPPQARRRTSMASATS